MKVSWLMKALLYRLDYATPIPYIIKFPRPTNYLFILHSLFSFLCFGDMQKQKERIFWGKDGFYEEQIAVTAI